jgi:TRAP-type mannitol/chloroaromatic compound transport system permease small subunit
VKAVDWINGWVGKVMAYSVFVIFVLLMIEVIRRYLLNAPSVWGNELTQMIFGAYAVPGGAYILAAGAHVNVDIVFARLSRKTQAKLNIATFVLFAMFCGMMFYYGGSLAWEALSNLESSASAWDPPIWPVKLTIPIGAGLLFLQGVANLIRDILIVQDKELDIVPPQETTAEREQI